MDFTKGVSLFQLKSMEEVTKKGTYGENNHKNEKKNHHTIHFHEKLAMPFYCRAVQLCLETMVP